MSKEVHKSLRKIAKGTLIVLLGTIIGSILSFFARLIFIRNLSQSEFGTLSLVITIVSIAVSIGALGLNEGITRFIAYHRAQKNSAKVKGTIKSALEIAIPGAVLFFILLFFGANTLGKFFNNPELILPLKIYSVAVPFLLLTAIFVSVFRGFDRASIKVIFEDLLKNLVLLVGAIVLLLFGFSLLRATYVYLFSAICIFLILATYSFKKYIFFAKQHSVYPVGRALIVFSLPLLFRKILGTVISWCDILMLGYFKEVAMVGIYGAMFPLAKYFNLFLTSAAFLYVPLATSLFAQKNTAELKKIYASLTKWIFSLAFPIFLIFFLFPNVVINFLYGKEYLLGSTTLMILSSGYVLNIFLGPNGATLVAFGKTRFLMFTSFMAAISNVLLNLVLIPSYGIVGAAIASAISVLIANLLISLKLYSFAKISPFTKNYLKPILVSTLSIGLVYFIAKKMMLVTFWVLPILFILFCAIYCAALLLTRSFDKEDITMLLLIEKKFGLNLNFIKKIFKRFF